MGEESTAIDIESIVSSSQMFADHSVQELLRLNQRIDRDIQGKKQELRNLVGSKYRDLLSVADNVISMNELVQLEDSNLTKLIFQSSNYNNKYLTYLNKFHSSASQLKKLKLIEENLAKVAKSLLDDLDELFSKLETMKAEFDFWNLDSNEEEQSIDSAELLVNMAIFIYMINLFFGSVITANPILNKNFTALKGKTIQIIKHMLTELVIDGENDLVLNLLTSYLIIEQESPLEVFVFFLDLRFNKFKGLSLANYEFQNSLKYLFSSISYVNLFKTKLVHSAIRTIHLNNTSTANGKSWFNLPYIVKWKNWIQDYDTTTNVNFPQSISDLKSLSESKIDSVLSQWKLDVSSHCLEQIEIGSLEINSQMENISTILTGFKNYTSLVDLKLPSDAYLLDELIDQWRVRYESLIEDHFDLYKDITNKIVEIPNTDFSFSNSSISLFSNLDKDSSEVDKYLEKVSNSIADHVGPHRFLLTEIERFFQSTASLAQSANELLKLKEKVLRQVLSIDDAENDEFWNHIAKDLESIHNASMEKIHTNISSIEKGFMESLTLLGESGIKDTKKTSILLKCLMTLNNKPSLVEHFKTNGVRNGSEVISIEQNIEAKSTPNSSYSPWIVTFLKPLLDQLLSPLIMDMKASISKRFEVSSESEKEVVDLSMVWDKNSNEMFIPVQPSYGLVVKLYQLSEAILSQGENRAILETVEIENLKKDILRETVEDVVKQLNVSLKQEALLEEPDTAETLTVTLTSTLVSALVSAPEQSSEYTAEQAQLAVETPVTIENGSSEGTHSSKNKKKKNKKKSKKKSTAVELSNGSEPLEDVEDLNEKPSENGADAEARLIDEVSSNDLSTQETLDKPGTAIPEESSDVDQNLSESVSQKVEEPISPKKMLLDGEQEAEQQNEPEVNPETKSGVEEVESNSNGELNTNSINEETTTVDSETLYLQKALLTYADLIYLLMFLNKHSFFEEIGEDLTKDTMVIKIKEILGLETRYTEADFSKIHKNVFEFFKSNKSLYIF